MKRSILFILLVLALTTKVIGQYRPAFQKGSILTGVSFAMGFGNLKGTYGYDGVNTQTVTITPRVCYFPMNGLALGFGVDYASIQLKSYDSRNTFTEFTFGPLMRYYTPDGFFIHFDISFNKTVEEFEYGTGDVEKVDVKIKQAEFGLGYAFFVNPSIYIEPIILYRDYKRKSNEEWNEFFDWKRNEFVVSIGLSIFLYKNNKKAS